MTTVPGTYFTIKQLETALKVDDVSAGEHCGSDRMTRIGLVYHSEKKQYDKALAWYILAAREKDTAAQNNLGFLYHYGLGVPKNYLCALKWFLKAAERFNHAITFETIGLLFENGFGVPLDKHKALEWYFHGGSRQFIYKLKGQGYHRSTTDKKKTLQQLIKETEAVIDTEKRKLEEKQHKTQEEMETLEQLKITYKLTGGGKDKWNNVPILLSGPFVECFNELKKQFQILSQENSTFKDQTIELQSLKQEKADFELKIKEKDSKISSLERYLKEKDEEISSLGNKSNTYCTSCIQQTQTLNSLEQDKQVMGQDKTNTTNEIERLKSSYTILEQILKSKQDTIVSLNRENQRNQQGTNEVVYTLKSPLQAKNNEIELNNLKMENALDKEKGKIKKLLKEIKRLKQQQQQQQQNVNSGEARPSSSTTVPEATVPEPATSNTGTNEDDPNNDFNYDTECGTEYSSSDDTSSEDGDHANDLNYDSDV